MGEKKKRDQPIVKSEKTTQVCVRLWLSIPLLLLLNVLLYDESYTTTIDEEEDQGDNNRHRVIGTIRFANGSLVTPDETDGRFWR